MLLGSAENNFYDLETLLKDCRNESGIDDIEY